MKNKIIVAALVTFLTAPAFAESIARDSLTYIINRYLDAKQVVDTENMEIPLACAGEVFSKFTMTYLAVLDSANLNINLVNNYDNAKRLINDHRGDVEGVYPRLRENLVSAIRMTLGNMVEDALLKPMPSMSVENYAKDVLQQHLSVCNDQDFISAIAQQAPLTGDMLAVVEREVYRVPLADGEDDFGDITGATPTKKPELVKVKQSVREWLYEIYKR